MRPGRSGTDRVYPGRMATKFPPPKRPFIRARHHGGPQTPKAVVLHGTVSSDNKGTARNIANWWAGPTSPVTSAHYVVDPGTDIQCVGDHTVAYHCGYNTGSIGVEFCDEQTGPASRWADADSTAILKRAATLVAQLCLAYNIEPKRPSVADLKRKGPHGIYGHNDSRLAFGYTSHTDPRDFPWAKFIGLVRAEVRRIRREAEGPKVPDRRKVRIDVAHASMQFSDTLEQKDADTEKIFARAEKRGLRWITGTEAGQADLRGSLRAAAERHGYRLYVKGDCWIAVEKKHIKKGSWKTFWRKVIDGVAKRWTDKGVVAVTVEFDDIGVTTIIAAHYLTKGRPDAKDPEYRQNLERNRQLAQAIGEYARQVGKGKAKVFYGGDQNIVDRDADTFLGEPLTSLWDELKRWENTGHGNIDVIASYDADGRVVGVYMRALDDSEFRLFSDHFYTEGGFDVEVD